MGAISLSPDQQEAWETILTGQNVFITASAGGGKSALIDYIKENLTSRMLVTASTGIAANNIGGRTLHSQFLISPYQVSVKESLFAISKGKRQFEIRSAKLLIIDEISMVSDTLLSAVDKICQGVRRNSKPFGGLQIALFGDFLQLPPVDRTDTLGIGCWEGPTWSSSNIKTLLLTTNFRQGEDLEFYNLLTNLRYNRLTDDDVKQLEKRQIQPTETAVRLFSTNAEVDKYNYSKFTLLDPATELTYIGKAEGNQSLINSYWKNSIIPEQLVLRIGARVMLCVNIDTPEGYLFNGSCGTVIKFEQGNPLVSFDSNILLIIEPDIVYDFITKDEAGDVIDYAQVYQVPLKLAWACTVHKSQGQTFEELAMDCSRVFTHGQVYVALSRVRTLKGLYLSNFNIDSKGAQSNPIAVQEYLRLEELARTEKAVKTCSTTETQMNYFI